MIWLAMLLAASTEIFTGKLVGVSGGDTFSVVRAGEAVDMAGSGTRF